MDFGHAVALPHPNDKAGLPPARTDLE